MKSLHVFLVSVLASALSIAAQVPGANSCPNPLNERATHQELTILLTSRDGYNGTSSSRLEPGSADNPPLLSSTEPTSFGTDRASASSLKPRNQSGCEIINAKKSTRCDAVRCAASPGVRCWMGPYGKCRRTGMRHPSVERICQGCVCRKTSARTWKPIEPPRRVGRPNKKYKTMPEGKAIERRQIPRKASREVQGNLEPGLAKRDSTPKQERGVEATAQDVSTDQAVLSSRSASPLPHSSHPPTRHGPPIYLPKADSTGRFIYPANRWVEWPCYVVNFKNNPTCDIAACETSDAVRCGRPNAKVPGKCRFKSDGRAVRRENPCKGCSCQVRPEFEAVSYTRRKLAKLEAEWNRRKAKTRTGGKPKR